MRMIRNRWLKRMADVCLHASKSEGFGMNMLECQAVGTPVITTKFMAMKDYTKLGISVPHRQMIFSAESGREMALPDVEGIVDALVTIYNRWKKQGGQSANLVDIRRTHGWIKKRFSSKVVRCLFSKHLHHAVRKHKAAVALRQTKIASPEKFLSQKTFKIVSDEGQFAVCLLGVFSFSTFDLVPSVLAFHGSGFRCALRDAHMSISKRRR